MMRLPTVLIVAMLGACTSSNEPDVINNVASDPYQQDMNNVLEVSKGKQCGPAPLGAWPPRPVKGGIVNDAERAKSLGLVYLVSMYGKKVVTLPLSATLKNGVWTVIDAGAGKGAIGGERVILMCQSSGAVLLTYRTQ
jgi:hypothetical protein